ncbi:MAG TPA: maleylpyruvate isomerase family mycothiol-dependent enzyme [Thermoanaerobaculia bacterium]
MRVPEPILTAHLFPPLDAALVELLRSLTPAQWDLPTVAGRWTVKDVAAHLLDTALRRLSMQRDRFTPPLPPDAFARGLGGFVNDANARWVGAARHLSPVILTEMLSVYGPENSAYLASLDPFAKAEWAVSWAGEEESQNWFDVARELTERWHHQQQIRDAVGAPPLYDGYLGPVIDAFVRALPYTYREVDAPRGVSVVVRVPEAGAWSVVREGGWTLYAGEAENATTRIELPGDAAWRLFTKQRMEWPARVEGDARLAEPLRAMVCIVA